MGRMVSLFPLTEQKCLETCSLHISLHCAELDSAWKLTKGKKKQKETKEMYHISVVGKSK